MRPSQGGIYVDITEFGGAADAVTDNTGPFLKAYAALLAKLPKDNHLTSKLAGRIYFPGDSTMPYDVSRPLQVGHDHIELVGDPGSTVIRNRSRGPVAIFGLRSRETGPSGELAIDESYHPSRAGKLDPSFGGRGVRTNGKATIIFSGTPFDLGQVDRTTPGGYGLDRWRTISDVTVDFAIERGDGGVWPGGQGGIWSLGGADCPHILSIREGGSPGQFDVKFADSAGNPGWFSFDVGKATGVLAISLYINLSARRIAAWVNGVRVFVAGDGAALGVNGTGMWAENFRSPLLIGADPFNDGRVPLKSQTKILDFSLFGLAFTAGAKYAETGWPGSAQVRLDGRPIKDVLRYGGDDSRTFACLDGGEGPEDIAARHVWGWCRSNRFLGYFCHAAQFSGSVGGIASNAIRGCTLMGAQTWLSPVVHVGPVVDLVIEDFRIRNGTRGVASWPSIASYDIKLRRGEFDACAVNGVYGAYSSFVLDDITFRTSGRCTIETWACDLLASKVGVRHATGHTRNLIRTHAGLYGGSAVYDIRADYEGDRCSVAPFEHDQFRGVTSVECKRAYLGTAGSGTGVYRLHGHPQATEPASIVARAINAEKADYTATAFVDGDGWEGTIQVQPRGRGVVRIGGGKPKVTAGVA